MVFAQVEIHWSCLDSLPRFVDWVQLAWLTTVAGALALLPRNLWLAVQANAGVPWHLFFFFCCVLDRLYMPRKSSRIAHCFEIRVKVHVSFWFVWCKPARLTTLVARNKNGIIWICCVLWSSNFQGISRNYYSFWILKIKGKIRV